MVTLRTGEPQHDVVMGIRRPDGALVWISVNSQPLVSEGETRPHAVVTTFRDITEKRRGEQALRQRTRELQESLNRLRETSRERQELALRLVTAQEEERRRIASEVHDGSVQTMAAIAIRLGLLARELTDPGQRAELQDLREVVAVAQTELRTLMFDLRTPDLDKRGLEAALGEYLATLEASGGPHTELVVGRDLEADPDRPLSSEARVVLFQIAQEALINVRKHASASLVTVTMTAEKAGVSLRICDDGRGFDPDRPPVPGHLGMTTMKERAAIAGGRCEVESRSGIGTTVSVWVPYPATESGPDE